MLKTSSLGQFPRERCLHPLAVIPFFSELIPISTKVEDVYFSAFNIAQVLATLISYLAVPFIIHELQRRRLSSWYHSASAIKKQPLPERLQLS